MKILTIQKLRRKDLYFFIVVLFLIACKPNHSSTVADEVYSIYLVRHAEKEKVESKDPSLSQVGIERAKKLANLLQDEGIDRIFSTNFERTIKTGSFLADTLGIQIEIYDGHDLKFYESLQRMVGNEKVLVIGHSNTIPILVNQMIGIEKYQNLDENEYDKLFKIRKDKNKFIEEIQIFNAP